MDVPATRLPVTPAPLPVAVPAPAPSPVISEPKVVETPVEPKPYVSTEILLSDAPQIFEFVIKAPGKVEPIRVRGVAVSYDGKVLTFAPYFSPSHSLISAQSLGQSALFQGWLARDEGSQWLIVRSKINKCTAAQIVHRAYTQFGAAEELLLPVPTVENPNLARTMRPVAAPDGAVVESASEGFWITGTLDDVVPGSPLLNRSKYLLGLVDEVRSDLGLAHVKRISGPLALLNEATNQLRAFDWNETPSEENLGKLTIEKDHDAVLLSEIANKLTGAALEERCKQLLDRRAESPQAWYAVSTGYARDGKIEYAIASAKMLTQVAPKEWEAWFLYGKQLELGKQFGQALDAYQASADLNGPLRRLGVPMARCLYRGRDVVGTQEMLRRVLESDADNFDAWMFSGSLYLENKQGEGAVKAFTQAASINPQAPEAWQSLAQAYDSSTDTAEAVRAYKQVTLLQPGNATAWSHLGVALVKTHQDSPARFSLRRAIQLNPDDTEAKRFLAQLENTSVAENQTKYGKKIGN